MKLDEFLDILAQQNADQQPKPHKIGKPLKEGVLDKVRAKWKSYEIPAELVELYQRCDGIKLSCGPAAPCDPQRLLPMNQWKTVRGWWLKLDGELPGPDDGLLRDGLILTEADEETPRLVLSPDGRQYFSFLEGQHKLIGESLDAVLDWLHDYWLSEEGGEKRFTWPVVEKEEPPRVELPVRVAATEEVAVM